MNGAPSASVANLATLVVLGRRPETDFARGAAAATHKQLRPETATSNSVKD